MLEVGKTYKTYGEWEATPIWKSYNKEDEAFTYIVVHKPNTEDEQVCLCDGEGISQETGAVYEPPTYDTHHPADLVLE